MLRRSCALTPTRQPTPLRAGKTLGTRYRWSSSSLGACLRSTVQPNLCADAVSLSCSRAHCSGTGTSSNFKEPPAEGPLPEGLSTIQQLAYTLAQGQMAAHARLYEFAEQAPTPILKAFEALKEQYKSDVKGINDKYMESKRRWRYSLSQAVAHRHMPEEATRFESEASMWRRQWEGVSPELVEAARKVKLDHTPKVREGRSSCYVYPFIQPRRLTHRNPLCR